MSTETTLEKAQLSLVLSCNAAEQTVLKERYMAYPLSVSPLFRREDSGTGAAQSKRAYLYRMNTSPGLLAGDDLRNTIQLETNSQLYLADQSATKVHQMPERGPRASVHYSIVLAANSALEFLPEPLILFEDADLAQTTEITMNAEAGLCWGEIVLPGRLASGECYQFRRYLNKMMVRCSGGTASPTPDGKLWFAETMNLTGKGNRFVQSPLFASAPVLGTLILVLPAAIATAQTLKLLGDRIDAIETDFSSLSLASSTLPGDRGLFIRVMSETTREIQACFRQILNCGRSLQGQNPLPYGL